MSNELIEIHDNNFISKIEELINSYDLNGAIINLSTAQNPEENGTYFLCGINIQDIVNDSNCLQRMLENKRVSALAYYGTHLFRLDDCNLEDTYKAIKNFCKGVQSFKPIFTDKYINSLDKSVAKFDMYGSYIFYDMKLNTDYTGVYFVCGTNKDEVYNKDIDIKKIIESQNKTSDYFHYSVAAFQLDPFYSFGTHQAVMNFCRDSNFIRNLYQKYEKPIPEKVTVKGLSTMKMLNSNLKNPKLTTNERHSYEKAMYECFKIESSYHNPADPKFEKNQFLMSGQYDTSKGKIGNWIRQNFGENNNCVSLEHLFTDCNGAIGHISVNVNLVDKIKSEFNKRQDILYWISEPMGEVIKFPDGQGYGPNPSDNDIRTVDIAYNAAFEQDVDNIVYKICYPEAYILSPDQLAENNKPIHLISILQSEYKNFVSLCNANNVPFCMDTKFKTHDPGHLNIVIPKEKEKTVDLILSRLCLESEQFQISLDRPNIQEAYKGLPTINVEEFREKQALKNSFPKEKITEKLSKQFPGKDFTYVGGSFDDFDDR